MSRQTGKFNAYIESLIYHLNAGREVGVVTRDISKITDELHRRNILFYIKEYILFDRLMILHDGEEYQGIKQTHEFVSSYVLTKYNNND